MPHSFQNLGGVKSPPDSRDYKLAAVSAMPEVFPESYFIDISKLPIWYQRKIGACVGHAWAKSQQYSELADVGKLFPLSARFVYALSKSKDGYLGEGTYPRIAAKVLQDYGCCTEDLLQNDTNLSHADYINLNAISASAYIEGMKHRIANYAFSDTSIEGIQHAIFHAGENGEGVVMLVQVGKEWWTDKDGNISWNKDKILPIKPPAVVTSGHEIYPYGWDKLDGRVRVHFINSWSADWADGGKGWFFYDEYSPNILEIMTSVDLPSEFVHAFNIDMKFGDKNNEVQALQLALQLDGEFPASQTATGYYGELTRQAVLAFQKKYSVASLWEIYWLRGTKCGPKTRIQLNKLFS